MAKKRKSTKRRKPKGKLLSERLEEKERARQDDEPEGGEDADVVDASYEDEDDADEDEPVGGGADDDVVDAGFEDEAEDDESDEDADELAEGESDEDADELAEDEELDEDELAAAAQMGHQRYVIAGFFGLWIVVGYICGQAIEMAWAEFAARPWFLKNIPQLAAVEDEGALVSRASISVVAGMILGAAIVFRYYVKPEIRTWADEVAEQLTKVKWPTRKEVGNNTVVVIIASAIITLYLTLLDRFWGFVTNLIYLGGA